MWTHTATRCDVYQFVGQTVICISKKTCMQRYIYIYMYIYICVRIHLFVYRYINSPSKGLNMAKPEPSSNLWFVVPCNSPTCHAMCHHSIKPAKTGRLVLGPKYFRYIFGSSTSESTKRIYEENEWALFLGIVYLKVPPPPGKNNIHKYGRVLVLSEPRGWF